MQRFNATIRKRVFILLLVAISIFSVLLCRLAYVQLIQGMWLTKGAEQLWGRDIPFEARRGRILDRTGKVLTYNISAPSVMAVPVQIKDPHGTAKQLAKILGAPEDKMYKQITKKQLIVRLSPEGRKISDEKAKEIQGLRLPGITITEDSKRYYPYGNQAAHILGFTGIDNQGLAGLELVCDDKLKGVQGHISFSANAKGEPLPGGHDRFLPPRDGYDLMLTIDETIQSIVERELDQAVAQYHPENVLAIAMNPNTGEILGMGSRPTFRPDEYKKVDPTIYNRNLPIWKTFEPGSTFKIITLAAALQEKKVNLKERFYDPGFVTVGGARLRCWKREGHGAESYLEVVENSCNPGFVNLGQRLGKEKLFSYIKNFGFGEKTGIDLNGEAKGIMFKENRVGPVELATTAFGQGVSVTPIQQVAALSAVINGGHLMKPYLIKEWLDPETKKVLAKTMPEVKRTIISEETSAEVREALESVVARGTGRRAFIDGYRVGGKTGTAQKVGENGHYMQNNHIVSFIGFAPSDDPQIVVYIAVDNPQGIQFGGVVGAPIVGNIIDESLRYLGVKKRTNQIPPEKSPLTTNFITVPNLLGQDLDKVRNSLFDSPLKVFGSGDKVIAQMPRPGQRVKEGTELQIYLGN